MDRRPRALAVLALSAALLAAAPRRPWGSADCAFGEATYREAGVALLHRVEGPRPAAFHMPLASLSAACLRGAAWRDGLRPAALVLAAAAGTLAGGAAGGAAAAALAAWPLAEPPCHPQGLLLLMVLAVAALLALWARRPTLARAWALAASVGASFALRSTLAPFPPLLALWAWRRGARRQALVVGLAPYLAVVPWAAGNAALHGTPAPFELGQAGANLVAGALGLVGTVEGEPSALAEDVPDALRPGETLAWAAREALAHPRRALDAVVLRAAFAAGLAPWLWAAALAGLAAARRRREARALALLAACLLGSHVLMAVQENYFVPLWPVLAVLAALPLGRARYRLGRVPERAARGAALAAASAAAGLGGAAAAWALGTAVRHAASDPKATAALEAALARDPEEPTLRLWRGRRRLKAGELGAAEDFAAAGEGTLYAWTRLLEGRPEPFPAREGLPCAAAALGTLMQAEALARSGGDATAGAAEALALRRSCARARGGEAGVAERLSAAAPAVGALLADLAPLVPRGVVLRAPRLLSGALLPADIAARRALAVGLQDMGDLEGALAVSAGMQGASALADRGVALALAGRTAEARAALETALAADPGHAGAALSLGALLEREGQPRQACAVYARALAAARGSLRRELRERVSKGRCGGDSNP